MSDFFDNGDTERMPPPPIKAIRQKNTIIGILIAIIGVLVAILLVKGFDGSDNAAPSVQIAEETSSVPQPTETSPTATEDIAEEPEPAPVEEEVPEPTALPDDPESLVLLAEYKWMDPITSEATIVLQELLELEADGWYGMGTRAAHLAALEERGLPTYFAAICDITVGDALCAVSADTPFDEALATLISGLGPADNETEWYEACYAEYKDVYWGPVYARFNKRDADPDSQNEGTPPQYHGWGIENQYDLTSQEWKKEFPAEVKFAESNWMDWNGDRSVSPILTETIIPAGSYLTHSVEEFQENIGHPLVEDQYWGFYILGTNQYDIVNYGIGNWEWMTGRTSALACD